MNKKCISIIVILLAVIALGIYKFIFQGSTSTATDNRISILLEEEERDLVLTEMRLFLHSIQKITQAISEDDAASIIAYAENSGKNAQAEVPGTLIGKLPLEFKKMGSDTHKKFDQLAMDSKDLGDNMHSLSQLSVLMKNCVKCHATYRFDIENN